MLHRLPHQATPTQRQRAPRYLLRRGSSWHFRARLPRPLAAALGRHEVWRSLGADLPLARFCAAHLAARIDDLWAVLSVTADDLDAVVAEWFRREVNKAKALFADDSFAAAVRPAGLTPDQATDHHRQMVALDAEQRIEALSEDRRVGRLEMGAAGALEIAARLVPPIGSDDGAMPDLRLLVMRLLGEIEEARLQWVRGRPAHRPELPEGATDGVAKALGIAPRKAPAVQDDTAPVPAAKHATSGRTLREAAEQWLRAYQRDNGPTDRLLQGRRAEFEVMVAAFGEDRNTHDVSKDEGRRLVEALQELPPHWRKNPALGMGTIFDKATKARELGGEPYDFKTVKGHLTRWRNLFDMEGVSPNPFDGIRIKPQRRRGPKRDGFTDDEIGTIFGSALFRGSAARHCPYDSGEYLTDNWQFWACLIACFTGARIGEIAQLRPSDVTNEIKRSDGVWAIRITEDAEDGENERRLKNQFAERVVPVHPELERIGLIRLAAAQREKGAKTLLPDCPAPVGGDYGKQLSRWMSEKFLPRLGIKRKGSGFHEFRHTLTTWLRDAGVPRDARIKLAGRVAGDSLESSDALYGDWTMPTLHQHLAKIALPSEIAAIKPRRKRSE